MKQNEHLSIAVTKGIVVAIALACVVMCLRGPATVRWIMAYRHLNITGPAVAPTLLALGYLCAALAFSMLYNLYRFLGRLGQGALFVPQNVTALRRISLCCAGAAALCLPTGVIVYVPFAFLGAAAGFMALIVRVIQIAFAQAVRMKNELDLTI